MLDYSELLEQGVALAWNIFSKAVITSNAVAKVTRATSAVA